MQSKARRAFTLVELLVVIAIIGILIALLLPAIQAAREAARKSQCLNNIRQFGLAMQNHIDAKKTFPPGQITYGTAAGFKVWGWSTFILPYMEESAAYKQIDFKKAMNDPQNLAALKTLIPTYLCPSTSRRHSTRGDDNRLTFATGSDYDGVAAIDYAGVSGVSYNDAFPNPVNGVKYPEYVSASGGGSGLTLNCVLLTNNIPLSNRMIQPRKIIDGLSKTFLVCEVTGRGMPAKDKLRGAWCSGENNITVPKTPISGTLPAWINPDNYDKASHDDTANQSLFSDHPAGSTILLCDASAHFLTEDTELSVLNSLTSRNGGEVVSIK